MNQSTQAKVILKRNGSKAAVAYLKRLGWPFYLTMFVITGKWVME